MPSKTAEYSRIMLFVFWKEQPENTHFFKAIYLIMWTKIIIIFFFFHEAVNFLQSETLKKKLENRHSLWIYPVLEVWQRATFWINSEINPVYWFGNKQIMREIAIKHYRKHFFFFLIIFRVKKRHICVAYHHIFTSLHSFYVILSIS